jgi:hypothetical protein
MRISSAADGREGLLRLDGVADRLARGDPALIDREPATLHAGDVQQILNEVIHPSGGPLDSCPPASYWNVHLRRRGAEQTRLQEDGAQRIPEVVRDDVEDVLPQPDRLLRDPVEARLLDRRAARVATCPAKGRSASV